MLRFHEFVYGEHAHIGIYESPADSIASAGLKTLEIISKYLNLSVQSRVLDLGSGYGGPARYFANNFGCHVDCLNLSEEQNDISRRFNQQQGLDNQVQVYDGSFQTLPFSDSMYDAVICQDAMLYSSDRLQVFQEVSRVLSNNNGQFLLLDVMFHDNCPDDIRQKTLSILDLKSLASVQTYKNIAHEVGLKVIQVKEMPEQITRQYSETLSTIENNFEYLSTQCEPEFLEYQRIRLSNWVEIGKMGYLNWGILKFIKT